MAESIYNWSTTAATNATVDAGINWAEGQTPGSVNNSARGMMAATAKYRDDTGGKLTLAGGTTAYTLTTAQGLAALADGVEVAAVINATNTGAATLNVDSLGAKAILRNGGDGMVAIVAGEMVIQTHATWRYDASAASAAGAWILLEPMSNVGLFRAPDIILEEQQTSGTNGGTFTSGADRTRVLNTEVRDVRGECTLSTNQFTLSSGTYYIEADAPAYSVLNHQALLYNVSDTAEVIRGTAEACLASTAVTRSYVSGTFTIAASKALELRHRCNTTQASNGFGIAGSFGTERFSRVGLWRLA